MTPRRTVAPHPPLPPADARWLEPLFDAEGLLGALRPHAERKGVTDLACRLRHIRYRPANSGVFLYEVEGRRRGAPVSTLVHAVSAPPARRPAASPGLAGELFLDAPLVLEDGAMVVREYPDDAGIRGLERLQEPAKFAAELAAGLDPASRPVREAGVSIQVVRYKPGVRLVLRCDVNWRARDGRTREETCYVRFDAAATAAAGLELATRLQAQLPADGSVVLPTEAFRAADGLFSVAGRRRGDLLALRMKTPAARAGSLGAARTLARFHGLDDAAVPRRTSADARAELLRRIRPARGYAPALAREIHHLHAAIEGLRDGTPPGPEGLVHGDFHPGQVLVDGDRIVLLDLERVHRGETASDLGSWAAQLDLLAVRGKISDAERPAALFLDAYAAAGGALPDPARLRFWTAAALLELALREMRRLKGDWPARTAAILERCRWRLEKGVRP